MTSKDFHGWAIQKPAYEGRTPPPYFAAREIWWAALGVNIGYEQDGKGAEHARPVLIVRRFGALFYALPLSTTSRRGPFYFPFSYKDSRGESVALLSQLRALDSRRLIRKDGMAGKDDFQAIMTALTDLLRP